jgi:lipopolysaccharide export system permease protein
MPSILFIASTRIGDAVLSSGALAYAQQMLPDASTTIACGVLPAPLFRATPGLAKLCLLEKRRGGAHWFNLINELREGQYDLAVDLRGTLVTYALRARRRIVYRKSKPVRHKVAEISELMQAPGPLAPTLFLDAKARADASEALPDAKGALLVLGAGANFIGKRWPPDRFASLAARLVKPQGVMPAAHVILLGGAEDAPFTREIVERLGVHGLAAHDLAGRLDLPACAALLERATLFIGNDSGLMHIAAAAGAPTLGLFGPSDERIYGPWGSRTRALRGRSYEEIMALGPLDAVRGTLMNDLSVDAVEAAAVDLMRAGGLT